MKTYKQISNNVITEQSEILEQYFQVANMNYQDSDGNTLAMVNTNCKLVQQLFEHGDEVNAVNNLVYLALQKNDLAFIDSLVCSGSLPKRLEVNNLQLNELKALFYSAVKQSNLVLVKVLVRQSKDINLVLNTTDSSGDTPLLLAIRNFKNSKDAILIIKLLVKYGANIKYIDPAGNTALHLAAKAGSKELVKLLVAKKSDVNIQNNEGNTPLHEALMAKKIHLIPAFLKAGANASLINKQGLSALQLGVRLGKKVILELFKIDLTKLDSTCRNEFESSLISNLLCSQEQLENLEKTPVPYFFNSVRFNLDPLGFLGDPTFGIMYLLILLSDIRSQYAHACEKSAMYEKDLKQKLSSYISAVKEATEGNYQLLVKFLMKAKKHAVLTCFCDKKAAIYQSFNKLVKNSDTLESKLQLVEAALDKNTALYQIFSYQQSYVGYYLTGFFKNTATICEIQLLKEKLLEAQSKQQVINLQVQHRSCIE